MLILIKEKTAQSGAARLFGSVFPKRGYVCAEGFAVVDDRNAVVIVEDGADAEIKSAHCVIADGESLFTFPDGILLVTCGANPKNTVSFTSRSENTITLSLNRAVHTKTGITEPFEFPVRYLSGFSEFDYMSAFAADLFL